MPKPAKTLSAKEADALDAQTELLKLLKPGDSVYAIVRHVSSSGMSRIIDLCIPHEREDSLHVPLDATLRSLKDVRAYTRTGEDQYIDASVIMQRDAGDELLLKYPARDGKGSFQIWRKRADLSVQRKVRRPAIRSIGWLAARAMQDSFDRDRQGIRVSGCGMDMCFHTVYNLGATLWPKGTPKPHGTRNGEPDRAGGYALKKVDL